MGWYQQIQWVKQEAQFSEQQMEEAHYTAHLIITAAFRRVISNSCWTMKLSGSTRAVRLSLIAINKIWSCTHEIFQFPYAHKVWCQVFTPSWKGKQHVKGTVLPPPWWGQPLAAAGKCWGKDGYGWQPGTAPSCTLLQPLPWWEIQTTAHPSHKEELEEKAGSLENMICLQQLLLKFPECLSQKWVKSIYKLFPQFLRASQQINTQEQS